MDEEALSGENRKSFLEMKCYPNGELISLRAALRDFENHFDSIGMAIADFKEWKVENPHRNNHEYNFDLPPLPTFSEKFPDVNYPGLLQQIPHEDIVALDGLVARINLELSHPDPDFDVFLVKLNTLKQEGYLILKKYR